MEEAPLGSNATNTVTLVRGVTASALRRYNGFSCVLNTNCPTFSPRRTAWTQLVRK